MRFLRCSLAAAILCLLVFSITSRASAVVILGSTDSAANTTAPTGALAGSGWQWTGQYNYTNATAIAPNWVLVAEHWRTTIPSVNTVTFNGVGYSVDNVNYVRIGTTDLTLLKVNGQLPGFAPLSTVTAANDRSKFMMDIGRGKDPGSPVVVGGVTKGWLSGPTNTVQRWGTNTTSTQTLIDFTLGNFLLSTFDASGGFNEMSLDIGDSGGPLFVQEGSTWKFAGLNYAVDATYSLSPTGSNPFRANIFDPTGLYENSTGAWTPSTHGTQSYYSHVGSSYALIAAATGLSIWTGNATAAQTWSSANWGGAPVPNGTDKTAEFTNSNALGGSISVNQPVTLGTLVFASSTTATGANLSYNISGPSAITFDVSSINTNATLRVDQGNHTISAPITVNRNLNFDINGTQLVVSGGITNATGKTLFKTGSGALQLTGSWNNGAGAQFFANAGATTITGDMGSNTSVAVNNGAVVTFAGGQHLSGLTVNYGARANLASNLTLVTNSLNVFGGTVDLGTGNLIVHATATSKAGVFAAVLSSINSGFNGGSWAGLGITSSYAAADRQHLTTLATVINDNGQNSPYYTYFVGEPVGVNDVLVRYTWYGDANLDGTVDAADLALLLNGFSHHLSGWRNGDFNGDGFINGADFALFDDTYNFYSGVPLTNDGLGLIGLQSNVVPEPQTLLTMLLGAGGLCAYAKLRAGRTRVCNQPRS